MLSVFSLNVTIIVILTGCSLNVYDNTFVFVFIKNNELFLLTYSLSPIRFQFIYLLYKNIENNDQLKWISKNKLLF